MLWWKWNRRLDLTKVEHCWKKDWFSFVNGSCILWSFKKEEWSIGTFVRNHSEKMHDFKFPRKVSSKKKYTESQDIRTTCISEIKSIMNTLPILKVIGCNQCAVKIEYYIKWIHSCDMIVMIFYDFPKVIENSFYDQFMCQTFWWNMNCYDDSA